MHDSVNYHCPEGCILDGGGICDHGYQLEVMSTPDPSIDEHLMRLAYRVSTYHHHLTSRGVDPDEARVLCRLYQQRYMDALLRDQ